MKHANFLLLCPVVLLTACSNVKEKLGMERTSPDEFAVVERAPLTLPPNFGALPQPGTAPTQQVATDSARGLVLGSESSAPKAQTNGNSAAEQALLSKVGAANANPSIRQDLANPEQEVEKETVAQQLGITPSDAQGKAIDPTVEATRLKQENVKTTPVVTKKTDEK